MLAHAFTQAGHNTQTISFQRQFPSWLYPGKSDKDPSQRHLQVEAQYLLDPFKPWTWFKTGKEINTHQSKAVVIQWWTTFWAIPYTVVARKVRSAQIPVIFVIHNVLPHEKRFFDRFLARLALSQGDAFIVQTRREEERLKELIGARQIALCKLPNYSFFKFEQITRESARQILDLTQDAFILLFFGLVRSYKGLGILIEAMGDLRKKACTPSLVIAGEFWDPIETYKKQIQELGLTRQIQIHNRYIPDEEVGVFFSAADFVVMPYTNGTQSAAATIAYSFGKPMIVSTIVAEGLDDENRSNLVKVVPAGDVQALAEAIRNAMAAPTPEQSPKLQDHNGWGQVVEAIFQAIER